MDELDLGAEDPDRFLAAVRQLRSRQLEGRATPLPPPAAFPRLEDRDVDDEIEAYLKVLARYPFDPPISAAERIKFAVDAVLESGHSYAARALSLLAGPERTRYPAAAVLDYVRSRGLHSSREIDQAGWLVDYLLDDRELSGDVLQALSGWRGRPDLVRVLQMQAPRLPADWTA